MLKQKFQHNYKFTIHLIKMIINNSTNNLHAAARRSGDQGKGGQVFSLYHRHLLGLPTILGQDTHSHSIAKLDRDVAFLWCLIFFCTVVYIHKSCHKKNIQPM